MQSQKIEKAGHLLEITYLITQLTNIHSKLIDKDPEYENLMYRASPYFQSQILESNKMLKNKIEICLNAVYGFLLLRLNGQEVTPDQQKMLEVFGDVLSYLSFTYTKELKS